MKKKSIAEIQMLFIIGLPRSGTKLLRNILNNHSKISLTKYETNFIPTIYNKYGDKKIIGLEEKIYNDMLISAYGKNISNNGHRIPSLEEVCGNKNTDISEIIKNFIYNSIETNEDIIFIGDKSPRYTSSCDILNSLYPACKIIHIVRDSRDVSLSVSKAWNRSILRAARQWNIELEKYETVKRDIPGSRLLEINYERLIENPKRETGLIQDWLSLEHEEISYLKKDVESDRRTREVMPRNSGKYIELKPRTIRRIEEITFDKLLKYGYELKYASKKRDLSILTRYILYFYDHYKLLLFHVGRKGFKSGIMYYYYLIWKHRS